jgi:hypothetical protein
MKPIKPSTVKVALRSLKQQKLIRQTAAEVGISRSSVHNISRTLAPTRNKSKGGRPRKFDYRNAFYIRLLFHRGIIGSAADATRRYNDENEDPVSANTVRRALRDIGLQAKREVKKPRLTKSQKKARLDFALKHKDWTEADWKQVIWSDESKINRISSDGMRYTWVQSNNEPKVKAGNIDPKLIMPTVKYGGGSIMIWGCMTWDGPGFLAKIDSGLDSELYIRILQDELLNTVPPLIDPMFSTFLHSSTFLLLSLMHPSSNANSCFSLTPSSSLYTSNQINLTSLPSIELQRSETSMDQYM